MLAKCCLEDGIDAAANASGPHASERLHASLETLATLPHRVLADGGASKGRDRRILSRLAHLNAGLALDDELDDDSEPRSTRTTNRAHRRKAISDEQKLAARI